MVPQRIEHPSVLIICKRFASAKETPASHSRTPHSWEAGENQAALSEKVLMAGSSSPDQSEPTWEPGLVPSWAEPLPSPCCILQTLRNCARDWSPNIWSVGTCFKRQTDQVVEQKLDQRSRSLVSVRGSWDFPGKAQRRPLALVAPPLLQDNFF